MAGQSPMQEFASFGSGSSSAVDALTGLNNLIFGTGGGNVIGQQESTTNVHARGTGTSSQTNRSFGTAYDSLKISDEAIAGIIQDIMSEGGGLAEIFAGERATGLYNSTVAAEEAGDLAAKILAEVGKLRATRVQKTRGTDMSRAQNRQQQSQSQHTGSQSYQDTDGGGGILDNLGF